MSNQTKTVVYQGGEFLQAYFNAAENRDIEQCISLNTTQKIKQDPQSYSSIICLDTREVFVKVYQQKSFKRILQSRFARPRGYRTWQIHCQLADATLAVPRPLAYIRHGISEYIFSECKLNTHDLRHFIGTKTLNTRFDELDILTKAAKLIADMHKAGFTHGDCKWGNFLWGDSEHALYMVDFDGVKPYQKKGAARDLARFMINAEEAGIEEDQINKFLTSYCRLMQMGERKKAKYDVHALEMEIAPIMERIRIRHHNKG